MPKGVKYGGRQKGTPNKTTSFTKQAIQEVLAEYIDTGLLSQDFKNLSAKDRVDVVVKLAGFIIPKPQAIDMSVSGSVRNETIDDILVKLAQEND